MMPNTVCPCCECVKFRMLPQEIVIDGELYPPNYTEETIRTAKAMVARPSDIIICTYPKCGTTWIQHIVHQLIGRTSYDSVEDEDDWQESLCYVSPMIEYTGGEFAEKLVPPRVLKTHFTYENTPKNGGAKYIYAVRNPKDCLTSYFHHTRNFKIYKFEQGKFDDYFDVFHSGHVGYGDYYDHLLSWLDAVERQDEKILLLTYEDMMKDLRSAVVKIARFLGGDAEDAVADPRKLDEIVKSSSLGSMKENQQRWFPKEYLNTQTFIRKGGSRDWRNHLTLEQSDLMDKKFDEMTAATKVNGWWKKEMEWEEEDH